MTPEGPVRISVWRRLGSFRSGRGPLGVLLTLAWISATCGPEPPPEEAFYLAASESLGAQAHGGRPKTLNPRLVSLDNPRLPERVLAKFRSLGYEIMETAEEDPAGATYYLSTITRLAGDTVRIRVHISMGGRYGSMDRGDSWWEVIGVCREGCEVVGVTPVDNRSWR